jgi:hypothetical protein
VDVLRVDILRRNVPWREVLRMDVLRREVLRMDDLRRDALLRWRRILHILGADHWLDIDLLRGIHLATLLVLQ